MPSTYTTRNRAEMQAVGENGNLWGGYLNTNTLALFDAALDGLVSFTGNKTLTTNNGAADEGRMRFLNITGGTTATVTIPNLEKWYLVRNAGSGDATITTGSGTTATVKTGQITFVVSTGANVVYVAQPLNVGMASLGALSFIADRLPYCSGTDAFSLATFTAAGRALVDDADATAQIATLGLAKGFGFFCGGTPLASEVIGKGIAPYAFTITTANCSMHAETAATAQTIFTIKKNGSSIGTGTFAISGTSATMSITGSPVSVAAGDRITIHAPSSADATLADVAGMLR